MLYMLLCEDKPDSEALRLATRDAHLAYAGTRADMVHLAGPMLSDDTEHMVGSLFLIEADSADAARRFHEQDPYTLAGLWGRVVIRPFRQVLPRG
jgi:uncharacterized protein YciI